MTNNNATCLFADGVEKHGVKKDKTNCLEFPNSILLNAISVDCSMLVATLHSLQDRVRRKYIIMR
jgi:hypothetical protein